MLQSGTFALYMSSPLVDTFNYENFTPVICYLAASSRLSALLVSVASRDQEHLLVMMERGDNQDFFRYLIYIFSKEWTGS